MSKQIDIIVEGENDAFLSSFDDLESEPDNNQPKEEKPLRQILSHGSMRGLSEALPGSFPRSRSMEGTFLQKTSQTLHLTAPIQGADMSQRRNFEEKHATMKSSSGGNGLAEEVDEEDDIHDTITSLAGAKMMQWYHKALTGSRKDSSVSLNQNRLEDLFLIEEDSNREDTFEEDSDLGPSVDIPEIKEETFVEETDVFVPPDGGYGWFVALGAFIALMWTSGTVKSYGVIFESILEEFPDTSVSLSSWIPASLTTLALAMAPVASALCSRYNCRNVTFAGGLFCALGICLSGLATCVEHLFFTFGILTGIGVGLSTTPGIILVARYFNKKRGMANAFCLSGTATGSFFIPFLIEYLLEEYGFRNTLLVLGGCMLHLFISGALYRPLPVHVIITRNARKKLERLNPRIQIESQPGLDSGLTHNASRPFPIHHPQHKNLQHHQPFLRRQVSDPHEVVSRLQSRLKHIASEETMSLNSDRATEGPSDSQSDLQSLPISPLMINQGSVQPQEQVIRQNSAQMSLLGRNSSLDSREDVQCQWSDSRPSIKDIISQYKEGNQPASTQNNSLDIPIPSKARALSLKDLYVNQLGNRLSSIFGEQPRKGSSPNTHLTGSDSPALVRKVESIVSIKGDEEHVSNRKRNSSFLFTFEDFMTDSTCILKDTRYPIVNFRRESDVLSGSLSDMECENGRIVSLGRSVSMVSKRGQDEQLRRQRYVSEGLSSGGESILDVSTNRFQMPPPSRFSSFSSSISYSKGRKESGQILTVGTDNLKKDASTINEHDEDKDLVDEKTSHPVVSCFRAAGRILGISLCTDPRFVIVVISVMSMSVGAPHVLFFLPSYTHSLDIGIDPATLLASISVFDLLGRIAMGLFVDANLVPKFVAYATLIFMSAASIIILPFVKDLPSVFVLCSFYGFGVGGWFLMVPLLLADFFGVERIGASYGLVRLFQSLSNLMGPIVAGLIKDQTGSFRGAYLFMGAVMFIGCPVVLLSPFAQKRVSKTNEDLEK